MRLHNKLLTVSFGFLLACLPGPVSAQQTAPDNSKQNANQSHDKTADKQPNAQSDRQTAAHVRKAIVADKSLSTYAHNVKVLVVGGQVTLKGPVQSEDEKSKVAADAATVVSADSISNQLTVK
jgi:hyperosmotically inducible protein